MHSPFLDASGTLAASRLHDVTPRQRLEGVLEKLPAAGTQLDPASREQPPAASDLVDPIQRINEVMRQHGLEFDLSEERLITRVIDRESGDVIRQIPAEEVLRIAEHLHDQKGGSLLSSQA